ncbi:Long-chain-acyl-CoA synthetase family protein [Aphelenchoides besseyi]|nr:Long-chain-acyl-CoA synthetase family protein [Aphelenchoides besseyi]
MIVQKLSSISRSIEGCDYQSQSKSTGFSNDELPITGFNHQVYTQVLWSVEGERKKMTESMTVLGKKVGFDLIPSDQSFDNSDHSSDPWNEEISKWDVMKRDFKFVCVFYGHYQMLIRGLMLLGTVKWRMRQAFRRNKPLHYYFLHWVHNEPSKQCIYEVETGRSFTFAELNKLANRYANYFHEQGFRRGDVIALFMENNADFFALWLGLSKLGIITAWVNSQLKLEPLAHSVNTAHATTIVTTPTLLSTLRTTISEGLLPRDTQVLSVGKSEVYGDILDLCELTHDETEPSIPFGHNFESILCYIYTSGTTGNPKAAPLVMLLIYAIRTAFTSPWQPLYHSSAGIIGIGQTIIRGSTAIIRRSFSAQEFWKDAIKHDATVSQYIGEICRYLLSQPYQPEDQKHQIRMMYGNGLRPAIWKEFVDRFGIERIGEFYGSTEGNSSMLNIDGHRGSCGFIPVNFGLHKAYPMRLLKVDPETQDLCRTEEGLCIPCKPGDIGEVVGMIKDDAHSSFEGYLDQAETEKKVIRNVLQMGDAAFETGDILFMGQKRLHRRGDTYRWRGENVSTTEVEGVLQPIMSIEDATVYGVEVLGREGRAGMIGATLKEDANVEDLLDELAERLPEHLASFAIPLFLRICKQVNRTGTFKLKKSELQKQGFDPTQCGDDSLYYWNAIERKYLPLDSKMFFDIQSGVYSRI